MRHLCVSCLPERPQRTEYSPLLHNQLLCPRSTTTNHKRSSSTTQPSFAYILNLLSTFSTNFAYSTFSPFSSPILSHTTGCIGSYSSTTKPATLWILHVPLLLHLLHCCNLLHLFNMRLSLTASKQPSLMTLVGLPCTMSAMAYHVLRCTTISQNKNPNPMDTVQ